jgi:hypothetical protein
MREKEQPMSDRAYQALALNMQQLVARLERLEEVVRLHPEVDPVPFDAYRYARSQYAAASQRAMPGPIADPPPWRFHVDPAPWWRWPIPQPGDPAPLDVTRWRDLTTLDLVDAVARMSGTDASKLRVEDLRSVRVSDLLKKIRDKGDPPPDDWRRAGRLAAITAAEIELMTRDNLGAVDQDIKAEITRLRSLEALVQERLEVERAES